VRKITVGQVSLQVTPAGEVQIDGKPVQAKDTAQVFDMTSGEHTLTATRPGTSSAQPDVHDRAGHRHTRRDHARTRVGDVDGAVAA
jgi:hypothetical protein